MPDYMLKGPNDQSFKLSVPDGTSEADIGHQIAQMMPSDADQAQDARDAAAQRTIRSTVPGEREEGPITRWAVGMGEGFKSDLEAMGRQLVRDPGGFMVGMVGGGGGGGSGKRLASAITRDVPEKITAAGTRINGKIYTGPTHMHAYTDAEDELKPRMEPEEWHHVLSQMMPEDEGFMTSKGRFVSREEAASIADRATQINKASPYNYSSGKSLASESMDLKKKSPWFDALKGEDDVLSKQWTKEVIDRNAERLANDLPPRTTLPHSAETLASPRLASEQLGRAAEKKSGAAQAASETSPENALHQEWVDAFAARGEEKPWWLDMNPRDAIEYVRDGNVTPGWFETTYGRRR